MTENRIQSEIFQWYWNNYCLPIHKPRCIMFHVPNENQFRNKKAIGVVSGVADLVMIHMGMTYFIEVKTEEGSQSPSQRVFENHIQNIYGPWKNYFIMRSLSDFKTFIARI